MSTRTGAKSTRRTRQLVELAITLIEAEGLQALSMRRLAEAYGVQPASIYWHVPGREALLDLVADELNRQAADYLAARKRPCPSPAAQLTHLGYLYRSFLHAHPQSELLLASRLSAGPHRVGLLAVFVQDLIAIHGLPAADALTAASAVRTLVHGHVIEHHARTAVIGPDSKQPVEASLAEFQQALTTAAGGHPQLAGAEGSLGNQVEFENCLHALVAGLSAVLATDASCELVPS